MHILRIEHPVADYDAWKKAFDSDPVARKNSGVRRYRIIRPVDDPKIAMVDLEFDSSNEAQAMLLELRKLWRQVEGRIMTSPQARIVEVMESREL